MAKKPDDQVAYASHHRRSAAMSEEKRTRTTTTPAARARPAHRKSQKSDAKQGGAFLPQDGVFPTSAKDIPRSVTGDTVTRPGRAI